MNNSIDQGFNTLIFDAGNLFFKKNSIDPGVSLDVAKENARTIVKSFNYISCDAFSPGSKDFAAGLNFLKELSSESQFDYISCNIKDMSSNLIFNPYKIIDRGNLKIGVIGASSAFESDEVLVEDPHLAINEVALEIKDLCDVVVLLFSASDNDYRQIKNLDNVDFAVRANTRRKSSDGGKGRFPIYSTGDRGKVLYQFDFKYDDLDKPLIDIAYFNKAIKLDTKRMNDISPDGDANLKEKYSQNIINYSQIINAAINSLQVKQITLDKNIQDNPSVLKIVDEGKIKTRNLGGPLEDPHRWHNH